MPHVKMQVFYFHIESQVIYFLSSQAASHLSSESISANLDGCLQSSKNT